MASSAESLEVNARLLDFRRGQGRGGGGGGGGADYKELH